jgi:hypothetical protein
MTHHTACATGRTCAHCAAAVPAGAGTSMTPYAETGGRQLRRASAAAGQTFNH